MNTLNSLNTKYVRHASDDPEDKRSFRYLCADSRSVFSPSETVFAAIDTPLSDGHRFITELYAKGVRAFIVERIPFDCGTEDAAFYVVDSVREALENLAADRLGDTKRGIAVTGSYGKTIVKELIYKALLPLCDVRRSPRSWNSSIGVPLSVWEMTAGGVPEHFIAEIGIDGPGQAESILRVLGQSLAIGVLTPVTDEHDEAFASHADKIKEKARLFADCSTVIYENSDPSVPEVLSEVLPGKKTVAVEKGAFPTIYHALADAVLAELGYSAAKRSHIPALELPQTRREITSGAFGNTILRDNFTPDLLSLRMALDFMRRRATPRHPSTLILGDILHKDGIPDKDVAALYSEAFRTARLFGADRIICVSPEAAAVADIIEEKGNADICADVMPMVCAKYLGGELCHREQILLFGKNEGNLAYIAETMECVGHDTTLEVDLDALVHNYNHYRSLVPKGTGIVAMVKASAYGAGAVEIGKTLQSHGAAYLAVAVIEEGIELRDAGITMPIVVLNPLTNRYPALFANRLEPTVFSPEELDRLIKEAEAYGTSSYPIHVKFDTGMHRVGFLPQQIDGIAERLAQTDSVKVASVLSHLATADCLDMDDYTLGQIEMFKNMTDRLRSMLDYPIKRHILNTAGMMRFADALRYEMGRLGIGLYGISPYAGYDPKKLRPVSSLRTHIFSLKHWDAGTPIGYGCRSVTKRPSLIATIPVGYADGINRHLGRGNASFYVNGTLCPTIGNICMDQCMIDVTDAPGAEIGSTVEIFGPQQPVEVISDTLDTIPYEILTSVSPRVKRVYTLR